MKKNFLDRIILVFAVMIIAFSCNERSNGETGQHKDEIKYTCPMHPQIIRDKTGQCPICGMDLVPMTSSNEQAVDSNLLPLLKPVNEQVISSIPVIKADYTMRILSVPVQGVISYDTRKQVSIASRVAGRIERMYIKYNYQPVSKGQLIMEIYSPDLAAAQRELIYLSRNDDNPSMLQKARQRLSLLGMQSSQIKQVERSGKPLYRVPVFSSVAGYIIEKNLAANISGTAAALPPASSSDGMGGMGNGESSASSTGSQQPTFDQSPVMVREGQYLGSGETIFTIYQANSMVAEFSFTPELASELKPGQKLVFHPISNPDDIRAGVIGLVEPVQKNGQSFTIARVYLPGTDLHAGQLLTASFPLVKNNASWLPEKAVFRLGSKSIVFKKENQVFVPKQVIEVVRTHGLVQIKTDISDWLIAENASFLVDSESFIRLHTNGEK